MSLDLAALARRRRELAVGIALVAVACVVLVPDLAASGPLSRGAAMVALGAPRFVEETASAGIDDGPRFTSAGELVRPVNYREWVYLSSGLGMTYGPIADAARDSIGELRDRVSEAIPAVAGRS